MSHSRVIEDSNSRTISSIDIRDIALAYTYLKNNNMTDCTICSLGTQLCYVFLWTKYRSTTATSKYSDFLTGLFWGLSFSRFAIHRCPRLWLQVYRGPFSYKLNGTVVCAIHDCLLAAFWHLIHLLHPFRYPHSPLSPPRRSPKRARCAHVLGTPTDKTFLSPAPLPIFKSPVNASTPVHPSSLARSARQSSVHSLTFLLPAL